jgi:hypothetical protein
MKCDNDIDMHSKDGKLHDFYNLLLTLNKFLIQVKALAVN